MEVFMANEVQVVRKTGLVPLEKQVIAHTLQGWALYGSPFEIGGEAVQLMTKVGTVPDVAGQYQIVQKAYRAPLEKRITALTSAGWFSYGEPFELGGAGAQAMIKGDVPVQPGSPDAPSAYNLKTWALTLAFTLLSATRDANDAIIEAQIKWPDGVEGVFLSDVLSTAFPGAIDAWHGTHGTQTITQPLMTRNANGAVIAQPEPVIS
jgi:hypothetical protein